MIDIMKRILLTAFCAIGLAFATWEVVVPVSATQAGSVSRRHDLLV